MVDLSNHVSWAYSEAGNNNLGSYTREVECNLPGTTRHSRRFKHRHSKSHYANNDENDEASDDEVETLVIENQDYQRVPCRSYLRFFGNICKSFFGWIGDDWASLFILGICAALIGYVLDYSYEGILQTRDQYV